MLLGPHSLHTPNKHEEMCACDVSVMLVTKLLTFSVRWPGVWLALENGEEIYKYWKFIYWNVGARTARPCGKSCLCATGVPYSKLNIAACLGLFQNRAPLVQNPQVDCPISGQIHLGALATTQPRSIGWSCLAGQLDIWPMSLMAPTVFCDGWHSKIDPLEAMLRTRTWSEDALFL